ncbi:selenide, water dikinase SelD [Fulvivirgaceae bacterium PWU4]|uniref:Selenide, water dikinase n=1 Tax=Chryseosolibacter histidini TaxID=2782349 RepID=A0AAP2GSM6_9BACT|nr:selenide, water dikinase SelD [Chryseosolibacter histidini]MBT1701350.1 selenide, water dikinase SelD [Chryseosolibacter histidini]
MEQIKLTQYSHGAGCGCKISPAVLDKILHSNSPKGNFSSLLVGNESKDDAAVFDLGDGTCIVSTTDFFMPIVDDPFTFGAIASVNAISDVYAMGGEPLMAIAILGWPINKIPAEVAQGVLEGSRDVCRRAGIPLAGGHSIDCPEPVFGLAVTGKLKKENLKRNDTAREGALLYLTKPLGIGIVTTAQKKGIVKDEHLKKATDTMLTLNAFGAEVGKLPYVSAMTDVTGFGLLGHLCEMCEGSNLSATLEFSKVPVFDFLDQYIQQKSMPGGTTRNLDSYGHKISTLTDSQKAILADPQTSGGLLIAVDPDQADTFEAFAKTKGHMLKPFGRLTMKGKEIVQVV